jgi:hypothetical protein
MDDGGAAVSGGRYDYLYSKFSEASDRPDVITAMAKRLEPSGHDEPAAATREVLRLADSLGEVSQAVEWADSGDAGEDDVAQAVARFRRP